MMNPNNNNNNKLIEHLKVSPRILTKEEFANLYKDLNRSDCNGASISTNNLDNVHVDISPDIRPCFESYTDNIFTQLKIPKYETFETLYELWKNLNYICTILDDTIYVESTDKSKFFIINRDSFTIKSNNDKGITLDLFILQMILDTIDYLNNKGGWKV